MCAMAHSYSTKELSEIQSHLQVLTLFLTAVFTIESYTTENSDLHKNS